MTATVVVRIEETVVAGKQLPELLIAIAVGQT
jgi:hypothetical protein